MIFFYPSRFRAQFYFLRNNYDKKHPHWSVTHASHNIIIITIIIRGWRDRNPVNLSCLMICKFLRQLADGISLVSCYVLRFAYLQSRAHNNIICIHINIYMTFGFFVLFVFISQIKIAYSHVLTSTWRNFKGSRCQHTCNIKCKSVYISAAQYRLYNNINYIIHQYVRNTREARVRKHNVMTHRNINIGINQINYAYYIMSQHDWFVDKLYYYNIHAYIYRAPVIQFKWYTVARVFLLAFYRFHRCS